MKRIVQCVPNFSEGKDLNLIKKIIAPLQNNPHFTFISYEADQTYNRTVVTILGEPEAMLEPLLSFFTLAKDLLDMRKHRGEHPRMGAVDVVPFIPISGVTMEECIDYAKKLGKKVSEELDIPVYLYALASQNSDKESLPNIRQGEFEGMETKMQDPKWYPDFGNPHPHPSFGVVAIGARMPLIAYNIDLATSDQTIANNIAKAIRKSSGGFFYIQAGGALILEKNISQVTMNILDYKKNPLYRLFEVVKMEAKRYHLEVNSSEIIGLIPLDALKKSLEYYLACDRQELNKKLSLNDISLLATKYLGLRNFSKDKIIEAYLERE